MKRKVAEIGKGAVSFIAASLLSACFDPAGDGPQLLVPEDISLHWDAAFDAIEDRCVALVPVDVMVYEGASGEAMAGVELGLSSPLVGAGLLRPEDVLPVDDEPADPAGMSGETRVWDAWRDRYFDLAAAEPRGSVELRTDDSGLARVYAWIDAFPSSPEGYGPIPFFVSMGSADDTFDDTFSVVAR